MDIQKNTQLWDSNPHVRLRAARDTGATNQDAIQKWVSSNCPVTPWPYGMPTVINPKIIVLGPSPGNSPAKDGGAAPLPSYDPPAFGEPHQKLFYQDTKRFFVKVRALCSGILATRYGLTEHEALSLSGMMNLDTGQFGNAKDVQFDAQLVRWVLSTIHEKLRPDYLICLGLKSRIADILPFVSPGLDSRRPHRTLEFKGYTRRVLRYHEWTVRRSDGDSMRLVLWPQHPSRAPFSNPLLWQASIDEYAKSTTALDRDL